MNPELDDATAVGFDCFPGFQRGEVYRSERLFPNVKSRLPNRHRPDYLDLMNKYDLNSDAEDWDVLVATRGRLVTDDYEFVRPFQMARVSFEVSGTRYQDNFDEMKKSYCCK